MNIKFDYVAGFLFNEKLSNVCLVHKQKPVWQKGKLNAVGGKIEVGESPELAMRREFSEEAGVDISDWNQFCVLRGESEDIWRVHFFFAVGDTKRAKQMESEPISRYEISTILQEQGFPLIPNLRWLIPMALNFAKGSESCSAFQVVEVSQSLESAIADDSIHPALERCGSSLKVG